MNLECLWHGDSKASTAQKMKFSVKVFFSVNVTKFAVS